MSDATFDPCHNLVIATELNTGRGIDVIPRKAGGTSISQPLWTLAQRVLWELFTRSLIRPYADPTVYELSAYCLTGSDTAPTLDPRLTSSTPPWNPPNLDPRLVAVKSPLTAVACP